MPVRSAAAERPRSLEQALHEAATMLRDEFGEVDQKAAVDLATFIFSAWERLEFTRRDDERGRAPDVE